MEANYPNNETWFEDHHTDAPRQIVDFLQREGLSLEGLRVADIGTGDGILALGLYRLAKPEMLVGYDIKQVDTDELRTMAIQNETGDLPVALQFVRSLSDHVPANSGDFDVVISWSVFEHVSDPLKMAQEMRRLLAPGGFVFIQLYPFYFSEHGDHGWGRPSFEHLLTGEDHPGDGIFLNRITFDELCDTLDEAGLRVSKVEVMHEPFHVPAELNRIKMSDLAIAGVKLIAVPNESWFGERYTYAPRQIVNFLRNDGLSLEGLRVAEIGAGDGILALGLYRLAKPEILVGYDLEKVDTDDLEKIAIRNGTADLPLALSFVQSFPDHVPATTGSFDVVVSWSAFEHSSDPLKLAQEMRRLLAPGGYIFIHYSPFYFSEQSGFGLGRPSFDHRLSSEDRPDDRQISNRITFDELCETLEEAGFRVSKVEIEHKPFYVLAELNRFKMSDLATSSVRLVAVPI